MAKHKSWFGIACMAFAGLAFSLTACDNDSVSNHAVVVPSGDSDEEDTASADDYLSELHIYGDIPCNAENEGLVSGGYIGFNPKFASHGYYKCQNGTWVGVSSSVTCDTAGVPVGGLCRTIEKSESFGSYTSVYVYEGDGAWRHIADIKSGLILGVYSSEMTKECFEKNKWEKEKLVYGVDPDVLTLYFTCIDNEWTPSINDVDYYCTTEQAAIGDTCSFTVGDSTRHYMFMNEERYWGDTVLGSKWVESIADPELGYCPQTRAERRYAQKDGKNYYCEEGGWLETSLVPRQNTDSRKEGLTDEEYDVLDLPKEAKVGDRAGGLLESCSYDEEMALGGTDEWRYETYDYCMPKKYYRYRDNGTWTLETEADLIMNNAIPCTAGTEGVEYTLLPRPREPGRIFKRTRVQCDPITDPNSIIKEQCYCADDLVEYIFGRSEKK